MSPLRGFGLLGFPNLIARPSCVVTVPDAVTIPSSGDLGPEWLKTPEPSDKSRILSVDPLKTRWLFSFTGKSSVPIDGVAAVNSNISPNGMYRFMEGEPNIEVLQPSSIISRTNASGTVSDLLDDIQYPDHAYLGPTSSASSWESTIEFNTPSVNPISGLARCMFIIRAKLFGEYTSIYPMCTVELYQGSTFLFNLGWRAVAAGLGGGGDGQVFIFPWNPSILVNPTGAGIRAKVTFAPGDNTAYAKMDSIKLYSDKTTSAKDSGWLPSPTAGSSTEDKHPTVSFHYFPTTPWILPSSLSVCILDDQVDHDPYLGSSFVAQLYVVNVEKALPDGFTDLGVVSAGKAMFLSIGETQENPITVEIIIQETGGKTLGGQSYGLDLFRRRGIPTADFIMTEEEKDFFMEKIAWIQGLSGAFYISANPDNETPSNLSSFWGVLTRASATRTKGSLGGEQYFTVSTSFEEKL